jgi:WD40 repeat protein
MVVAVVLAALAFVAFRQADQNASAAQVASTQAVSERYGAETAEAQEAGQRATAVAEGWARATQQAVAEEQRAVAEAEAEARATQQAIAEEQRGVAEAEAEARATAQAVAEVQARLATSRELAGAALASLDEDPERSALLALEALAATDTLEARNALRRALPEIRILRTLPVPSVSQGVAFSPDGKLLAGSVWGESGGVRIWDAASGEELVAIDHPLWGEPRVAFSPDGTRLFASSEVDLFAWEISTTDTGTITTTNPFTLSGYMSNASQYYSVGVNYISFSPDGERIALAHWNGAPTVFDVATMTEVLRLEGHAFNCRDVVFSPDGRLLATVCDDHTVRIWDAQTGQELQSLAGHDYLGYSVDFSSDGAWLVSADENGPMFVWDTTTGEKLLTVRSDEGGGFFGASFAPDGRSLVAPMADGTVRVWDAVSGELLVTYAGHTGTVMDTATSPDGTLMASAGTDSTVRIWTTGPVGELGAFPLGPGGVAWRIAFSPDGSQVAVSDGAGPATLWDPDTGELMLSLPGGEAGTFAVAYSPDGAHLAVSEGNGLIHLWNLGAQEVVRTLSGHVSPVWDLAFSPDGKRLASGGLTDGLGIVWDLASGQAMTLTHGAAFFFAVAFSPDGNRIASPPPREVAAAEAMGIYEWDATTGEILGVYPVKTALVYSVRYSPDGGLLAAGVQEGNVFLWDTSSGELLRTLTGHTGSVADLAFSPDGTYLASVASLNATTKVWDVLTGDELATFYGGAKIAWSPDGALIVTVGLDRILRTHVVSTEELMELARSRVTRGLTTQECQKYLHLEACPEE